jgi:hypothetical protein
LGARAAQLAEISNTSLVQRIDGEGGHEDRLGSRELFPDALVKAAFRLEDSLECLDKGSKSGEILVGIDVA